MPARIKPKDLLSKEMECSDTESLSEGRAPSLLDINFSDGDNMT